MARYVDGFVIPIQKKKLKGYLSMAKMGAAMWKEHGALAYAECVAEDLAVRSAWASRRWRSSSPARRWSSPGSSTSRGPTATRSTRR